MLNSNRIFINSIQPTIDKRSRKIAENKILNSDFKQNRNERSDFSYSPIINSLNKQIEGNQNY